MAREQPELHMPGWPELPFHGRAETDGRIWWWEERQPIGPVVKRVLQPYRYIAWSPGAEPLS
jgi:hypothetical protein